MAMDGRLKDFECTSSCGRHFVDAIERHSVGMGVHKAKKFFGLRREMENSGKSEQKIDNQSNLL